MIPPPSEIEHFKREIATRIYLGLLISFVCGFVLSGILIKVGAITV
jgi:hypothetical protein